MIKRFLLCGTLVACLALLTCCNKETIPEEPIVEPTDTPTTEIGQRFADPVMRGYVGNVIGYMYYNSNNEVSDNKVSIRNVLQIIALNLARNYDGAPNVSSLEGIKYMKSLKIIDLRGQNTLAGTYDLSEMSDLYYLRIEGIPVDVKFLVNSQQREKIMGTTGVFDGNETQVIVM